MKTKAQYVFEKTARILEIADIERNIKEPIPDELEPEVEKLISSAYKKSFALRHPILTGIATLGAAPSLAKQTAVENISNQLAKKYVNLANNWKQEKQKALEMLVQQLQAEINALNP